MAFTGIAAIAAGGASAVTAAVALAAIAEVGTILSIVGAVTGSKELAKLGGVMALVGGVGGLANNLVSGAATAATGAADAAGNAITSGTDLIGDTMGAGIESASSGVIGGAQEGVSSLAGATSDVSALPGIDAGAALQSPTASLNPAAAAKNPLSLNVSPTVNDVAGVQAPTGPVGAITPRAPTAPVGATMAAGGKAPSAPLSFSDYFKSMSSFAENNKTMWSTGVSTVGGALKGVSDQSQLDQKIALQREQMAKTGFGNTVANFAPRGIVAGAQA